MGFGTGSSESPLSDEAETSEPEPTETDQTPEQSVGDETPSETPHTEINQSAGEDRTTADFADIDVSDHYSTVELAKILMDSAYHTEDPQVPYAMWRDGTSTGRGRTTIELNPEVDDLVTAVRREFEDRYDAEINKADLREFALVYGLTHADEVFDMAEEWGLQYNS